MTSRPRVVTLESLNLMVMNMRYFLILLGLMVGTVNAEVKKRVYYCVDEATGGVIKNNGKWIGTEFQESRFKMKTYIQDDRLIMELDNDKFQCLDASVLHSDEEIFKSLYSVVICQSQEIGSTFIFDFEKNRYVYSSIYAYTYVVGEDTPAVHVGTCEDF